MILCTILSILCISFFFSSRRRHTRCALVTGVQTCALPIYHGVQYTGDAIRAAVDLSVKHIGDRLLPDKAIDVIDEAGARQRVVPDAMRKKIVDEIGRASCRERVCQYV